MQRNHCPFSDRKDLIVIYDTVDDGQQKRQQEQSTHVNLPSRIQILVRQAQIVRVNYQAQTCSAD